ncbi:MAG: hypothetical protein WD646_13905 [Actinomycetota bacterium]
MSDWDRDPVKAANDFFGPLVPGKLGCEFTHVGKDLVVGHIKVTKELIAGTGYLFAPAIIALADTSGVGLRSTKRHDGSNDRAVPQHPDDPAAPGLSAQPAPNERAVS